MQLIAPVKSRVHVVQVFPTLGHLDFTLGLNDLVIRHVLQELDSALAKASTDPASAGARQRLPSQYRQQYPWLNGFTNVDMVFAALDNLVHHNVTGGCSEAAPDADVETPSSLLARAAKRVLPSWLLRS